MRFSDPITSHRILYEIIHVLFLVALLLCSGVASAQDTYTISGHISDASSGEELLSASVYIKEMQTGTSSNNYGFYSITIPAGDYTLKYSMVGFGAEEIHVSLFENLTKNVELSPKLLVVDSIVVTAERTDEHITQVEMGTVKLRPAQTRAIPVIFGEQDILRTFQLLPGVKSSSEVESGFTVRGGGIDQNLILLDEATVYNASHLLGFFSVFNTDAIKDVKLIKGTASSEYGGRLSSVLDMRMKEGNSKRFTGSAGIGLVSSRVTLQAPIIKDKASFIISGRRTYFDYFMKGSKDESIRNSTMYFYDLNLKTNYLLDDNDHLFLSAYFGRDVFDFDEEFGVDWGNKTASFRWNHIFSNRVFLNSSLVFSTFDYNVSVDHADELIEIKSSIRDISLQEKSQYFLNTRHSLKFGFTGNYHKFLPGEISATDESSINEKVLPERHVMEGAIYFHHDYDASSRFRLSYGLRYTGLAVLGPAVDYEFNKRGWPIDSTVYDNGELVKFYSSLEPRVALNYILNDESSAKLSYARNTQYLHLLSVSTSTTPFDLWYPSTRTVRPGISDQVALGYFRNFTDDTYETSVEVYYKDLQNQVDYKNGANVLLNEYVESELTFGRGWAYGAEFLVRKIRGRFTGWLGYTASRSKRQFDNVNDGTAFPARQDRIHEMSIVGLYDLGNKWTFSGTWVYHSGNAVTFPSGKYEVDNHTVNLYTERNGYRMPAYHRLDLAFSRQGEQSGWHLSLYNAYGRRNAFAINFRENEDDPSRTEAVRLSLFSFFPSVTYTRRW